MDNETVNHVLRCPHPIAQVLWKQEMTKVHKWITDNKGCPTMADIIILYLNKLHHNKAIPPYQIPHTLHEPITSQNEIGWQSFIEGFWVTSWRIHQKEPNTMLFHSLYAWIWNLLWKLVYQHKK